MNPPTYDTWSRLREGNTRWAEGRSTAGDRRGAARRAEVALAQAPQAVVLGCADSRVPAELLFDQGIGDLFVVRTAGHTLDSAVVGSVEYAVGVLAVPLIIVLGHDECGAVAAACRLLDEAQVPPGSIRGVAEQIAPDVLRARTAGAVTLSEISGEHARYTVDLLRQRSPMIDAAIVRGELAVVPAHYCLRTGAVTEVRPMAEAALAA